MANLPDGSLGRPCAEGNKCTGVGCEAVGKCECEAGACRFAAGTAEELRDIGFENELVKSSLRRIPFETIPALVNFYIKGLLPFVGIWALIFFVFGGIIWLTSGGNPDKIKKAQQMMVWATIGIVFIFASYAIVSRIIPAVGG
ncbi:MAG: pilin [Gemmatimonadaceae bacterium]|nr:pilin [Gemmatimonadaceae bacterium]